MTDASPQEEVDEAVIRLVRDHDITDQELRWALSQHDEWREKEAGNPVGDWDATIAKFRNGYVSDEIRFAVLIALDDRRSSQS